MILVAAHAWYDDLVGGSFRLATEFARHLASRGRRVAYVCCDTRANQGTDQFSVNRGLPPVSLCQGVHVYRYPARPVASLAPPLWYHVVQTRRIARQLSEQDRVEAISGHSPLQSLGACLGARNGKPLRNYTVHSPFDDELLADSVRRNGLTRQCAAAVARWIDRLNIRLADRVQADSQYTLDVLAEKHGRRVLDKGAVVPGWVDASAFRPAPNRAEERGRLGGPWAFDGPLFFTLRRLEARMGLDTLIAAAARLRQRRTDFRVLIGGDGCLATTLQTMIRDQGLDQHVFLLGRIQQAVVPACYAAADCFVLPTLALECFGLIVLEAYAAGTPVIAADVAAIPELVRQAGEEWLFPPGNAEQLASRIASFLDGGLRPRNDIRGIACRYDRKGVLPAWEEMLGATWRGDNRKGQNAQ